ncbi:IS110 family transposase [Streptomyces sp. NPDC054766]
MAWNWAGTDIGKAHHHTVVLNDDGEVLLSRKVINDEPDLLNLLSEVLALGEDVVRSVDVADGMADHSRSRRTQPDASGCVLRDLEREDGLDAM